MSVMVAGLYHPESWLKHGHWHYLNQTTGGSGHWKNIVYHVNDHALREADFVIVHEDVDLPLTRKAKGQNFILVTGEEKSAKSYTQGFIDQFDCVITSRDDIQHPHVLRTHYFHPWSVKRSYDQLVRDNPVKTKNLSAIVSNATVLPGHKDRFAFMNKLKGHFKDRLDWFSKGENTFIHDKWDGLAAFRFSISIENSQHENYFTEKLSDCFLAGTLPFYWGCPNLKDFFDERSFISLDLTDFVKSIGIIESALRDGLSPTQLQSMQESKTLILEKYHLIAALTEVLNTYGRPEASTVRTIKPQRYFSERPVKDQVKQFAKRLLNW